MNRREERERSGIGVDRPGQPVFAQPCEALGKAVQERMERQA